MKKFTILIGIIVFGTITANAQFRYRNGVLSFNTDVNTGASTTWSGASHVFTGVNGGGEFWIKPASDKVQFGPGASQFSIYQDGKLSYNGDALVGAATTWIGGSHAFVGANGMGEFWIKPSAGAVKIGSASGPLYIVNKGNGFQDIYSGRVFVESDSSSMGSQSQINGATDKILRLRPVIQIPGPNVITLYGTPIQIFGQKTGFIAQEVEQVLPAAVSTAEDGKKMLDYMQIIPVLVAAMQEQQVEIAALKEEVRILKNQ